MNAFDEILDDFIWYLSAERRLSPNTVEAYKQDLQLWRELLPALESTQNAPDNASLMASLERARGAGWSRATEARRRATLRHYAKYRSLMDDSWALVAEVVPASKGEAKFPKALDLSQVEAFLGFEPVENSALEEFRDKALLELLYASGLRVSEARSLRWADISFDDGWVRVIGKGDAERIVPTSARALKWIREYQLRSKDVWHATAAATNREMVFLSRRRMPLSRMGIWKIVHKRGQGIELDDLHPHILRHSFATHLIQGGADVRVVQILLGHKSLTATERYLKISDRELFKLFTEFHPLG